jgi:hypothetical protein
MPALAASDDGWTYVREYRRCGRVCETCAKGPGHGPYWYAKRKINGRVKSRYIGKTWRKVDGNGT